MGIARSADLWSTWPDQDFTPFLYFTFLTHDTWWWPMTNSIHSCSMFWIHFSSGDFHDFLSFSTIFLEFDWKCQNFKYFSLRINRFCPIWSSKKVLKLVPSWDLKRKSFKTPTRLKWVKWLIILLDFPPKRTILRNLRFHLKMFFASEFRKFFREILKNLRNSKTNGNLKFFILS